MPKLDRRRLEEMQAGVQARPTPAGVVDTVEKWIALGDLGRALDLIRKGLEWFPNSERVQMARLSVVRLQRQKEIADLVRSMRTAPTQTSYERLAAIYLYDLGSMSKAYETALEGLSKFPESEGLHLICGQVRLRRYHDEFLRTDFDESVRHLRRAEELNRRNTRARLLRARLLATVGLSQEAKAILEPLRQEAPDDVTERLLTIVRERAGAPDPGLEDRLSEIESRQGLGPEARPILELFEEARPMDPAKTDLQEIRPILDALARLDGFRAAGVVDRDGKPLLVRAPTKETEAAFAQALHAIYRSSERASRRMDIGRFVTGEADLPGGTLVLTECRGFVFGVQAQAPARKQDLLDAIERFVALADR